MDNSLYIEEGIAELSNFSEIKNQEIINEFSDSIDDCSISMMNQHSLEQLKRTYTPVFLRIIKEEYFESGYSNSLDELVSDVISKDPIIATNWINDIHINYISNSRVLLAILFVISRIEDLSIRPSLSVIALGAMSHNDIEIRETAIRCFENWGDSNSLKCLKSSKNDNEQWVNDYKNQVIADIEKILN